MASSTWQAAINNTSWKLCARPRSSVLLLLTCDNDSDCGKVDEEEFASVVMISHKMLRPKKIFDVIFNAFVMLWLEAFIKL